MPLHERDTVREQLDECVFVGHDMTREVPKYRFPSQESGIGGLVRSLPVTPSKVLPSPGP
jgi:hypothetical protein